MNPMPQKRREEEDSLVFSPRRQGGSSQAHFPLCPCRGAVKSVYVPCVFMRWLLNALHMNRRVGNKKAMTSKACFAFLLAIWGPRLS